MKKPVPFKGEEAQTAGVTGLLRTQIQTEDNGKIKEPYNILTNVTAARGLYYRTRQDHLKRIQLYAQIEGLFAGNPPYNPAELAKMGLSHIANFNNLDGRALYERGALAYWNLLNSTEYLVKFKIRGQDAQLLKWANIMSKNWDKVVREWESFYTLVNTLCAQIVKFGLSPCIWPDEKDWKWRTVELAKFYVEDQAQCDVAQLTYVCVETTFTAQYLMEIYNEFKDSPEDATPWNVEALQELLVYRANSWAGKGNTNFTDAMDIQMRIQNGDYTWNEIYSDSIWIVSLLQKEYDGKISHYMFDRYYDTGEFLYFEDRQYDYLTDGLVIFTASPGEFTLHSNRGLGHKVFSGVQAMMQLDCSIIDAARWGTTPLIRSLATGSKDFETIRFYPGAPTNIGSAEFVENTMGANINQLIGASQYVLSKLQFNTANSGDDPSVPDSNKGSISSAQVQEQSFKEFSVLKNNIMHFYTQFDLVFRNMTVKMLNSKKGCSGYEEAKKWKELCMAEGVPKEIFETEPKDQFGMPKHLEVKASRVAGDGSNIGRIKMLQALGPIASSFGPEAMKAYQREWILATAGAEYLPAFLPDSAVPDERSGGASLAGLENNSMENGQSPIFSPDNEQKAHIVTHMGLANHVIKGIKDQQMSPVDGDKVFTVLIPHIDEHVQFVSQDIFAQQFLEELKKPLQQIEQYALFNRKNAAAMIQKEIRTRQEQKQKQDEAMSDIQRKDMVAAADIDRKNKESDAKDSRAQEQSDTKAEVLNKKVEREAANQRLKIELDADNKKVQTSNSKLKGVSDEELQSQLQGMYGDNPAAYDFGDNVEQ